MIAFRDMPVQGLQEDTRRKALFKGMSGTVNEVATKFQTLAKRYENDEKIQVEYVRKSFSDLKALKATPTQ